MIAITSDQMLIFRVGVHLCAIPIGIVSEVMRPLPISPFDTSLTCVAGVAILRGAPVPVVSMNRLLGSDINDTVKRFVALRIENRSVILAVSDVIGIRIIPSESLSALPPLLGSDGKEPVASLSIRDRGLMVALNMGHFLTDELWSHLEAGV